MLDERVALLPAGPHAQDAAILDNAESVDRFRQIHSPSVANYWNMNHYMFHNS